jgi:hypothetical protein
VICGTNFGYSQTVIHSHSKPELLAPRPWLGSFATSPPFARIDENSTPGFGSPNPTPKSSFPNCYLHLKLPYSWNNTKISQIHVTLVIISS